MRAIALSSRAQRLLRFAHDEADKAGCIGISSEHLLIGALVFGGYLQSALCSRSSLSADALRATVNKPIKNPTQHYSKSTIAILRKALRLSHSLHHRRIDAAHLVLAILTERRGGASHALDDFKVKRKRAKAIILKRLKSRRRSP